MKTQLILKHLLLIICVILLSCSKKNHPPTINNQIFSIDENAKTNTLVGQVLAIDEDNDKALTYSIIGGNNNDAFKISESDGKLTVLNEQAIDYETTQTFSLSIEVKDSKNKSSIGNVTVNLNNINPPANGLLLYLPFDGNLNDLSINGNNGIDYTSHNYVSGKWSQGLDFNGTTDYLKLTNTINSSSGLSFSFWIKTRGANGTENNGTIICKYNMTTQLRCFQIFSCGGYETRTDNRLSSAFYKYGSSSSSLDLIKSFLTQSEVNAFTNPSLWTISNPLRLEIGTWIHCVVNVTNTSIEAWINGVLCTSKSREYTSYFDSSNEPTYIGNNLAIGEGTNNHFNGILDEFRVYSRGLTSDEIKTLFKEK